MKDKSICVIGLGYVGLPLAVEFGKTQKVIGFDINTRRISQLIKGIDITNELTADDFKESKHIIFTDDANLIRDCTIFIITVPTPIDIYKRPNLQPLHSASSLAGSVLKKGDIVVYESTVYPGTTEEYCVPVLEEKSGLKFNTDFFVGYSPERINPGDKNHRLINIKKITSGSTPEAAQVVDDLYKKIIIAGTYKASSIKVAEAAKVIENTQRDLNIALINELAIIFNLIGIDTQEVLNAAGTKWNFLNFKPGLVGGHCIGVDPYYLTHKAQSLGYHPELILAGRRINDNMGSYIASLMVKKMSQSGIAICNSKILILGFTFKEDCSDIRNTKVVDIYNDLLNYNVKVDVFDPCALAHEVDTEYGIKAIQTIKEDEYDAILIAVAHKQFINMGIAEIRKFGKTPHVLFDVKNIFPAVESDMRL